MILFEFCALACEYTCFCSMRILHSVFKKYGSLCFFNAYFLLLSKIANADGLALETHVDSFVRGSLTTILSMNIASTPDKGELLLGVSICFVYMSIYVRRTVVFVEM